MKSLQPLEQVFHYRTWPVRTVQVEGEPWFVAADICAILGLANNREALARLDTDEKASVSIADTSFSYRQTVTVLAVSEPGLYSLVLRSRKSEARAFRRWITHEVIPALRTKGLYRVGADDSTVPSGPVLSRRDLLNLAVDAESECEQLRSEVAELAPKAEFYDRVANVSSTFSFAEVAKMLEVPGCGRNNLIKFLRKEGILSADNVAKQRYVDRGYFQIVQVDYTTPDGRPRVKAVTRVREKGVDFIRRRLDTYLQDFMEAHYADLS